MRTLLVTIVLLAALLPLPGAAAKALAEDPAGDAQVSVFGLQGAAAPAGLGDAADLLSLEVLEDAEALTFILKVTNLKQQVNFADYEIRFTWGKDEYAVVARRAIIEGALDDNTVAYIVNLEEDRWDAIAYLDHAFDLGSGSITIHLPKPYILSENGRYPLLGDSLEDVYVEGRSHVTFFQFGGTDSYDRMPDGEETLKYDFLFGDLAGGNLRLDAEERVRVSNGGATTFVYQVTIQNKAEFNDDVTLALNDMPDGWNGTVQSPLMVPGGSERRVAILVSVPFAHDHGGFSSFNVTATSANDPAGRASIRMGVLHTPIPQPAGHHAELYLHASSFSGGIFGEVLPWTQATMNTDANHDNDAPEASPYSGGDEIRWFIPLDPGLRMGLDFDVEKLGEISGSIVGHGQSTGKVSAELHLMRSEDEEGVLLGETDAVDVTLDLSTPAPFKLTLTPTEESDYIPYMRGQNLYLILSYEPAEEGIGSICCIPGATPGLTTADFLMKLPLNEYHDRLTGLAEAGDLLEIKAEGPVEKTGLPGATMTYAFTLTNRGSGDEIVKIDVAGTDADLGTLVPGGTIALASQESRKITLAVAIPTDKNDGEELEVLVFAHAQDDPSKSAIARTKTIVAKQGSADAMADETSLLHAAQAEAANDTPAPGVAALAGLLAIVALMVRRRTG